MNAEDQARKIAAQHWNCPIEEVYLGDVTSIFPFITKQSIILAKNNSRESLRFVCRLGEIPIPFDNHLENNTEKFNTFLRGEGLSLSGNVSLIEIGKLVHYLFMGPGGFVGSSEFLEKESNNLDVWTIPSPEEGAKIFIKYCEDPVILRSNDVSTLYFSFFNNNGGVEGWEIDLRNGYIDKIEFTQSVPNGTFFSPYF